MKRPLLALALTVSLAVFVPTSRPAHAFGAEGVIVQSTIMNAGSQAAAVSRLRSVNRIGIFNIDLMFFGPGIEYFDNMADFRMSAQKNAAGISRLRAALRSNPVTARALSKRVIDRTVGIRITSNNSITVYILRPRRR